MEMSEQIDQLASALSVAQGQIEGASKNSANPFFKSKYADLASVWAAIRKPLTDNGLSVVQSPHTSTSDSGLVVSVETVLLHSSGQWMRGTMSVTAKENSPQAAGSCVSYLRRYALQSFAGVAPEDDDAEAAEGRKAGQTAKPVAVAPKGYDDWLTDLAAVADEGTEKLQAAWKASKADYRNHLTTTNATTWEAMKARAAKVPQAVSA